MLLNSRVKILILGGTREGRDLAELLVAGGHDVITSLAGRVTRPAHIAGEVRVGGFGGAEGLAAWLLDNGIERVVDATHPFAEKISANAVTACQRTGISLLRIARPSWESHPLAGTWTWVDSHDAAAAVAARCLRYWRTDPRYLVQFLSILLMPVVLVLVPTLNSSTHTFYVNGQRLETSLAIGHAPVLLLFMAPALAMFMGWAIHDDLGLDSTALWSHISAGVRGAHDRLGRVVGAALWQVPLLLAVDLLMSLWTGQWAALPAVTGACLALHGCALAWSCLTSVLLPYETLAPGDSPMRSRTSGTAFLAAVIQMVAMLLLLGICSPVLGVAIYGVAQGSLLWEWGALALGGVWCSLALWVGVVIGGRLLDRRGPQVLATIRTWPGHAQPV